MARGLFGVPFCHVWPDLPAGQRRTGINKVSRNNNALRQVGEIPKGTGCPDRVSVPSDFASRTIRVEP